MESDIDLETGSLVDHGEPVRQFSVMLPNRVGALAAMVKLLRGQNIEVLGLSVQDSRDATVARLVVSDPESTETLFIERGFAHAINDIVVIAFRESATELLQCLDTLMVAETNIDFAYALLPCPEGQSMLAMHVEDYEFAVAILHQSGFKLMYQRDLSR
ncbi:MAG: hypothetical protein R3242_05800 [Akkermansiaceae bacterium]|nr:hypothetical protein [Akkermansiaceae bacterium]